MADYRIPRRQSQQPDAFSQLKQQGLQYIQQLAGQRWTDYNLHDPGITILEQLCFSLTELQYRNGFDIADLLTRPDGNIDFAALGLVSPEQILTCRPTTAADYRRYLLDQLPELADIYLQPDDCCGLYQAVAVCRRPDEAVAPLLRAIRRCYSQQRNLGEQLGDIRVLSPLRCQVVAQLDISSAADPAELLADVYYCCQQLLQKNAGRRSYTDLLAQTGNYEQLFNGPLTPEGVLDGDGLLPQPLQITDFFLPLQQLDGVVQLKQFSLLCEGEACYDSLPLQQGLPLYYLLPPDPDICRSVQLQLGSKIISVDSVLVAQRYQQKLFNQHSSWRTDIKTLCPPPRGHYRRLDRHHSIQNLFPEAYGLKRPLALSDVPQLQLKGYLQLFDQLLANFLAQLQQLPAVFSPFNLQQSYYYQALDNRHATDLEALHLSPMADYLQQLYQRFDDVLERKHRLLDYLLALYGESLHQHSLQHFDYYQNAQSGSLRRLQQKVQYLQQIVMMTRDRVAAPDYHAPLWRDAVGGFIRKQALLLDLPQTEQSLTTALLRHHITLSQRSSAMPLLYLDETAGPEQPLLQPVPQLNLPFSADSAAMRRRLGQGIFWQGRAVPEALLQSGSQLQHYRLVQAGNGRYQVLLQVPHSQRDEWWLLGSGLSARTAVIQANCLARFICYLSQASEGMHLLEHIMLRPAEIAESSLPAHFYSGRISVLCPAWTARFADAGFQQLVCETLQLNCPPHLSCQVYFLSFKQMHRYERLFKYWRSAVKAGDDTSAAGTALAHFIARLSGEMATSEASDAPA